MALHHALSAFLCGVGDGFVTRDELVSYLLSVYTCLYHIEPSLFPVSTGPSELAMLTTQKCFAEVDTDNDNKLTLGEFTAWLGTPTTAHLPILAEVQALTGLGSMDIRVVYRCFAEQCSEDGFLSKDAFVAVLKMLMPADLSDAQRARAVEIHSSLFHMFDEDGAAWRGVVMEPLSPCPSSLSPCLCAGDGMVDYSELVAGLTVLCGGGNGADRARISFDLFDTNSDGVLDLEELTVRVWMPPPPIRFCCCCCCCCCCWRVLISMSSPQFYLQGVFRVMLATKNTASAPQATTFTALQMAQATAKQCIEDADVRLALMLSVLHSCFHVPSRDVVALCSSTATVA